MEREIRKAFVVYTEWLEFFDDVSEVELARIFKALFAYSVGGPEPEFTGAARSVFRMMRNCLDRDSEKYDKSCQRRSEAAAKRWNAKNTIASDKDKEKEKDKKKDNDNDKEREKDKEKDKVKKPSGSAGSASPSPSPALGRYKNIFLSIEDINSLYDEFDTGKVDKAIEEISEYCASSGKTYRSWSAAIRRWIRRDSKAGPSAPSPAARPNYHSSAPSQPDTSYDLNDWMKTALGDLNTWMNDDSRQL